LVQAQYVGDYKNFSGTVAGDRVTNNLLAFQGGAKYPVTDKISAKAAITFTTYTGNKVNTPFVPGLATNAFTAVGTGTNDLKTIEIPIDVDFNTDGFISYKLFGDFVYNTAGDDRYAKAVANGSTLAIRNALSAAGNDDTAWLIGAGIKSAQGKAPTKGDWEARLWWQDVGIYAIDQNANDSDFMDSRLNMKGVVLKGQYNVRDNVVVNFAAGQATRKNHALATAGTSTNDIGLDLNNYQLYQLDLTYRF
jgi:hypothetical protein